MVPSGKMTALAVSYYLAATFRGFGNTESFVRLMVSAFLPIWLCVAIARNLLACLVPVSNVDRASRPCLVLFAIGLEAIHPMPALRSLLLLLAVSWIGLNLGDAICACRGEKARSVLEKIVFTGLTVVGLLFFLQTTIVHDAFQYVATLRALLVDKSTDLFEDLFIRNSQASYNPFPEGSLRYLGVPILEAPAYLAGMVIARFARVLGVACDSTGYSWPYDLAISFSSGLAGVLALVVSYGAVCRRVSRRSALIASVGFFLTSPLVFFTFEWHGWTHTWGALLTALFLDEWLRSRSDDSPLHRHCALRLGVLGGWNVLVWPPAGLLFLLPAFDSFALATTTLCTRRILAILRPLLFCAGAAGAAFCPQLAGWSLASGQIVGTTYTNVGDFFDWTHPHVLDLLFSGPRHGAITWHPILALSFLGLFLVENRRERAGLLTLVIVTVLVLSCWSIWWTGIGFGNRFLLQLSPVFVLGLATLLERFRSGRREGIALFLLSVLLFWNLSLMSAYRVDRIRMGIKAPNYVQDPAPNVLEVSRLVLTENPLAPPELVRPWLFNRTLFGERLIHAVSTGRSLEAASLTGQVMVLGGIVWFLVGWLLQKLRARPRALTRFVTIGLLLLSLLATIHLTFFCRRGPSRTDRVHLDGGWRSLETGDLAEYVFPRFGQRPSKEVHVLSFLSYGWAINDGAVVARVLIRGVHGETALFAMRAGRDTAECSYLRPDVRSIIRHRADRADSVRFWSDDRNPEDRTPLYGFRARFDLGQKPLEIGSIEIEYTHPVGRLTVTDLFLR